MACYAGGETESHPTTVTWEDYDYILATRPIVQILQTIDSKRGVMGLAGVTWPIVGAAPSIGAADAINWNASATPPLEAIKQMMAQGRSTLASLISASFVDGDCKRWRWSNTAAMTSALPSSTAANEKETWLSWVTKMRDVLELMVQIVSDAWTPQSYLFALELVEATSTGQRRMTEPGALVGTGPYVYNMFASGGYNNYGDCSGDSISAEIVGGLNVRQKYYVGVVSPDDDAWINGDVCFGAAFPFVLEFNPGPTPEVVKFNSLVSVTEYLAYRNNSDGEGFHVADDMSSPTGLSSIKYSQDGLGEWFEDGTEDFYEDKIGWFVIDETYKKYKVTFQFAAPTVPAATVDWALSASDATTKGATPLDRCDYAVDTSSGSVTNSSTTAFFEYTVSLDDFPVDGADYPLTWEDPQGVKTDPVLSINGSPTEPSGNGTFPYKIDVCIDACGNFRSTI